MDLDRPKEGCVTQGCTLAQPANMTAPSVPSGNAAFSSNYHDLLLLLLSMQQNNIFNAKILNTNQLFSPSSAVHELVPDQHDPKSGLVCQAA